MIGFEVRAGRQRARSATTEGTEKAPVNAINVDLFRGRMEGDNYPLFAV